MLGDARAQGGFFGFFPAPLLPVRADLLPAS